MAFQLCVKDKTNRAEPRVVLEADSYASARGMLAMYMEGTKITKGSMFIREKGNTKILFEV